MDKNFEFKKYLGIGITVFVVLISTIFCYFVLKDFQQISSFISNLVNSLISVVLGIALAYIFAPTYNFLKEKILNLLLKFNLKSKSSLAVSKTISTIITFLFVILIVFGSIMLIIPELISSINDLIKNLPKYSYNLENILNYFNLTEYKSVIYEYYNVVLDHLSDMLIDFTQNSSGLVLSKVFTGVYSAVKLIFNFLISLIVMIYVLNLKETLLAQFRKIIFAFFPLNISKSIIIECKFIHKVFSGFITGKILDSLIIGILCYIGLSILKMPYVLVISIVVGITNVIPFFGPFIGAIPSIILIALINPIQSLYFAIFVLALQQLDGNIIGPMILGNTTSVSPFYVLLSILLFGSLWGFVGMIIAVPLWGIIQHIISKLCNDFLDKKNLPKSAIEYSKEYVDKIISE